MASEKAQMTNVLIVSKTFLSNFYRNFNSSELYWAYTDSLNEEIDKNIVNLQNLYPSVIRCICSKEVDNLVGLKIYSFATSFKPHSVIHTKQIHWICEFSESRGLSYDTFNK